MHATGKAFGTKTFEMPPNVGMRAKEQPESLDNLIRQTIAKEPLFSFTRTGENPIQWIHWLDTLDQQNANRAGKGLKVEAGVDAKYYGQEENLGSGSTSGLVNGLKDCVNSSIKGTGGFGRGLQASGERMSSLRIPEAVVAFAQAAAKANDLPGWPLMPPSKVQTQKCDKCSLEFCSPLNYRRHIRITHRRPLNVEKEDVRKEKKQLAAFWDKLTPEEASHIVSSKHLMLEDLTGVSVVRALTTLIQQPGLLSLSHSYMKAGAALLDIVQNKSSRFPFPSKELLNLLDDSSEKTFLSVTSSSMQRYMFEGGAGKVGLETKNLVASLGFLIEQRLVEAWMNDKDAEALRCQKALVEEEEAAQKKQAEIQERKRLKKIRQRELKDKERKGLEFTSGLHTSDIDSLDGGNHPGSGEGDDSPSATQSSSSSSVYSGQYIIPDSSNIDMDEFEVYAGGRFDNMFFRLAEDESLLDYEDHQEIAWNGSSNSFRENVRVEENAETAVVANCEVQDRGHSDSDTITKNTMVARSYSEGISSEATDFQNYYSNQMVEHGKSYMDFRTRGAGRFVPDRKFRHSWKERKMYDSNDFTSYQKPLYGTGRRLQDVNSQQTNNKTSRKPYSVMGNSMQEHSGAITNPKLSAPSRYGQYHDKLSGTRRFQSASSIGHAVWTRKIHQSSVPESEKFYKSEDNSKLGSTETSSISLDVTGARQFESVLPESESMENGSTFVPVETSCCSSAGESFEFESMSTTVAVSPDARSGIWSALTEESDLTSRCGSGSCQSSASISDRVEVEDQVNHGDLSPVAISSLEAPGDQFLPDAVMEGLNDFSWQSFQACQPKFNVANGALVIGSLSVPLGKSSLDEVSETRYAGILQEKLKRVSKEIESLPGKKQRGEGSGFMSAVCKARGELASPACPEVYQKESFGAVNEYGPPHGEVSGDSERNSRDSKSPKQLGGEGAESLRQTNIQAVGHERFAKQVSWSNGIPKAGTIKVWRPVVAGGRHEITANGSISCSENGVLSTRDRYVSPATSNDGRENKSTGDFSEVDNVNLKSTGQVAGSPDKEGDKVFHDAKDRVESDGFCDEAVSGDEGTPVNLSECDAVEIGATRQEPYSLMVMSEDGSETKAMNGSECQSWLLSHKLLASFLSQRWADAVAAPESFVPPMHNQDVETSSMSSSVTCLMDQGNDDAFASLSSFADGKSLDQPQSMCCDFSEQGFENAGCNTESQSGVGSVDSEAGSRRLPSYAGKNADLPVNDAHFFDGNDASKSAAVLARVHRSGKQGEFGSLSGADGRVRVKDRWHQNSKVGVSEPRYTQAKRV